MSRDDDPAPRETPEPRPPGLRAQRWRTLLVTLAVFGLPALLALTFLAMRLLIPAPPFAEQPGGVLAGTVSARDGGALADVPVQAYVLFREGLPQLHVEGATDARGGFRLEVPPLDGCYLVRAGGGLWQPEVRHATLAEEEPSDLEFTLLPAAEVELRLSRRDGTPVGAGTYYFTLDAGSWPSLGLPTPTVHGEFRDGAFRQGGLAPGDWDLQVELESGEILEYEVTLDTGLNELEPPSI